MEWTKYICVLSNYISVDFIHIALKFIQIYLAESNVNW